MGNIKLSDWWNDAGLLRYAAVCLLISLVISLYSGTVRMMRLNDTNYLSVRITQLQAEQRLNICRAMLPGTREAKGYDKDCTDFTSNN